MAGGTVSITAITLRLSACWARRAREMSLAELEAAVAWLERNRLRDHLNALDGDARYAWTARQRAGDWQPPVGRDRRSSAA